MKLSFTTGFRMSLCALAVVGATAAQAQPVAQPAAQAPMHPHVAHEAAHHHDQKSHHPKKHKLMHKDGKGKHASPHHHKSGAAAAERKHGKNTGHDGKEPMNQYERNALNRCGIFKTEDDRRACVERVRQPQISGSVEGGGWIREYTQTVPVSAVPHVAPHGQHHMQPASPQK